MLLIGFMIIVGGLTQIRAQVISSTPNENSAQNSPTTAVAGDDCAEQLKQAAQMLDKTLDSLSALKAAKAAVDSELETNKSLRAKEELYNNELLKAVGLLASAEKRDKGFFKKLIEQLGKALKAATRPEHLTTIVTMIVLLKKL
jgi:hypothetical protein